MATSLSEKDKSKESNEDGALKPDQQTLHTTDPQEHMEGPISSLIKKTGEGFESDETAGGDKEDTDKD